MDAKLLQHFIQDPSLIKKKAAKTERPILREPPSEVKNRTSICRFSCLYSKAGCRKTATAQKQGQANDQKPDRIARCQPKRFVFQHPPIIFQTDKFTAHRIEKRSPHYICKRNEDKDPHSGQTGRQQNPRNPAFFFTRKGKVPFFHPMFSLLLPH